MKNETQRDNNRGLKDIPSLPELEVDFKAPVSSLRQETKPTVVLEPEPAIGLSDEEAERIKEEDTETVRDEGS